MMRIPTLLLLLPVVLLVGCGDSPSAPTVVAPSGRWVARDTDQGGNSVRSYLRLDNARGVGSIVDTTFDAAGGALSVDSIRLEFRVVGDGYQRVLRIRTAGAGYDTTLAYWAFFRRGDTLLYYRGMRYPGANVSIRGVWNVDSADAAITGAHCELKFDDSLRVRHETLSGGIRHQTYRYSVSADSIAFPPNEHVEGDRFEIAPGIALYITYRPTRRYLPLR